MRCTGSPLKARVRQSAKDSVLTTLEQLESLMSNLRSERGEGRIFGYPILVLPSAVLSDSPPHSSPLLHFTSLFSLRIYFSRLYFSLLYFSLLSPYLLPSLSSTSLFSLRITSLFSIHIFFSLLYFSSDDRRISAERPEVSEPCRRGKGEMGREDQTRRRRERRTRDRRVERQTV
eukprot:757458-Hanusia_phi.AAC.12